MITIRFRRMPSPKGKLAQLPKHATSGAAGADLHANIDEEVTIPPMGRALVPTGLAIELPDASYGAFVFARSGLAVKHGLTLSSSVGVIDSDCPTRRTPLSRMNALHSCVFCRWRSLSL